MVAGDVVNTASRIQSTAPPGSVYVGDATRRATEQTIAYENAGSHELQGKEGLFPLFRALRVVSGARGSLKAEGLEAPFVGRDRELRLVKEAFHGAADDRTAHLVSIIGFAGIGKSRLAWEFFKYIDGLPLVTYWHRGRCLSYGEGVTYWALADMVRMRCRIAEDEDTGSALEKLHARARRTCPRRGGTALRGAARCPSARPRGGRALRARRSLRRMADLLRAPERSRTGGDGVRGHAVGGRLAARLHRLPARVVAAVPHLRLHARPPGAERAPPDLGLRQAQLHLALPRAAARPRRWGSSWTASCRASPTSSRRGSGNGRKASRCTPSRPCG